MKVNMQVLMKNIMSSVTQLAKRTDHKRRCVMCKTPNSKWRCSQCKVFRYCSKAHQKADWKEHRVWCKWNAKLVNTMPPMFTPSIPKISKKKGVTVIEDQRLQGAKICRYCGRHARTQLCNRCRLVSYCSKKCQANAWKEGHNRECSTVVKRYHADGSRRIANMGYTFGNSPAKDLLRLDVNELSAPKFNTNTPKEIKQQESLLLKMRVLLNGSCDLREFLLSIEPLRIFPKYPRINMEWYMVDTNPNVIARLTFKLYLLYLIAKLPANNHKKRHKARIVDFLIRFWYSAVLTAADYKYMKKMLPKCLEWLKLPDCPVRMRSPMELEAVQFDFTVWGASTWTAERFWRERRFALGKAYYNGTEELLGSFLMLSGGETALHYYRRMIFNYPSDAVLTVANPAFLAPTDVYCYSYYLPGTLFPWMGWDNRHVMENDILFRKQDSNCDWKKVATKRMRDGGFNVDLAESTIRCIKYVIGRTADFLARSPWHKTTVELCILDVMRVPYKHLKFDRIAFSNLADFLGIETLVLLYTPLLNTKNADFATMIMELQNWYSQGTDEEEKKMFQEFARSGNPGQQARITQKYFAAYLRRSLWGISQSFPPVVGDARCNDSNQNIFGPAWGFPVSGRTSQVKTECTLEWQLRCGKSRPESTDDMFEICDDLIPAMAKKLGLMQ